MNKNQNKKVIALDQFLDKNLTILDDSEKCEASSNFKDSVMDAIYQSEKQPAFTFLMNLNAQLAYALIIFLIFINGLVISLTFNTPKHKNIKQFKTVIDWIGNDRKTMVDEILLVQQENRGNKYE